MKPALANERLRRRAAGSGALLLLAIVATACAHMPDAYATLEWKDDWGSRGAQVLKRDYAMCSDLVEQRRSALTGCMQARGWRL